jgi:amidase
MKRRRFLALGATLGAASLPHTAALAGIARSRAPAPLVPADTAASATENVAYSLARIDSLDQQGPSLHSFIAINPDARKIARELDEAQSRRGVRGPLHGMTVAVKDNIATGDRMATTGGSLALKGIQAARDATLVRRLREAGAIIVGKTNLSEWAGVRGAPTIDGWSAVGGLTRNPYRLDRTAAGSSSGSAVAVAARMVMMAVGTETDASIVSPAAVNGIVGLKPTLGRVSCDGLIPLARSFDVAGPMARTVTDAARLLSVLAGRDPRDDKTSDAPAPADYLGALDKRALHGARIGVLRAYFTGDAAVDSQIDAGIGRMADCGAVIVDPIDLALPTYSRESLLTMLYEFKHGLPIWLSRFAPHAPIRNLADLIAFNERERARELALFGQEMLILTATLGDLTSPTYLAALARCRKTAREDGLARCFAEHRLDAIVGPTSGTAWGQTLITGDDARASSELSTPAAVAGYPHLTVPAGLVRGLPVGMSFIGQPFSEARLLALGHAFEQETQWRAEPQFLPGTAR